jgi:hypothetical protein
MPDDVDELILKMQHLEAQVRAQREAEALASRGKALKTRAQQIAWAAQTDLSAAEAQQREAEEKLQRARDPALKPIAAADLLEEARRLAEEARIRIVKARAKLNFALDQMDEGDRREYEALRAEARAEAHAQMADDPLFKKTASPGTSTSAALSATPAATASSAPKDPGASVGTSADAPTKSAPADAGPRKTLGRRRRKGT